MNVEIQESEKIYVYKLITDNGGAPCVYNGLLSLSICKPAIRLNAQKCDWIIGFGGKSVPELQKRLIYIAQVTDVLENGDYYSSNKYRDRPDCIYRRDGSGYVSVDNQFHDENELPHDLGNAPNYDRARNLLSHRFVYFGSNSEPSIEPVIDIYNVLPRNYIKNHQDQNRKTLEKYVTTIVAQYGFKVLGKPTHLSGQSKCNESEDEYRVYPGCGQK